MEPITFMKRNTKKNCRGIVIEEYKNCGLDVNINKTQYVCIEERRDDLCPYKTMKDVNSIIRNM